SREELETDIKKKAEKFLNTRPTAVNLQWALNRMMKKFEESLGEDSPGIFNVLEEEARRIFEEDIQVNKKIGKWGASLIAKGDKILTHCNAGALATAGYGTALGVIRKAHSLGKEIEVFVDETRPVLQGARLTAWELKEEKIPFTLVTDNMAGFLMQKNMLNMVLVGADRITSRGDTANKIGTYALAVMAEYHQVPFYVAAPSYTFDMELERGEDIPIEEREGEEITYILDQRIAPEGVKVFNPSFDVTPHHLIKGIITEKGIIKNPDGDKISSLLKERK
ncbi:MAG: S-methyl-5-thioribose-1-phosphate isomerase, partial [Candidatus Syntrophonatronum acetioxidans]